MNELKRFITSHGIWLHRAVAALPVIIACLILMDVVRAGVEWFAMKKLTQTYVNLASVPQSTLPTGNPRDAMVKRLSSNPWAVQSMQLTGVLGDSAIFDGGMMVKAGESAGEMKVVSVGPNSVRVLKDGQEQTLWVFQPTDNAAPNFPAGPRRRSVRR